MNTEIMNQIIQYLDKIGAKLGLGMDVVWPCLIKQAYVEWYASIVVCVFFLSLFLISIILVCANEFFRDNLWGFVPILGLILLITIVFFIAHTIDASNPEYYALKKLFKMVVRP